MSGLGDMFSFNPIESIGSVWDNLTAIPGSPEAATQALYGGIQGDLSWNPYSAENSVWDYGAGGSELSQDPRNRAVGRMVGTAIGSVFTGGALGAAMGETAGAAANGALWGGAQAAGTGGNVEKAVLQGGLTGGLGSYSPDVAGYSGITNPTLGGVVNGGLRGMLTSAASGGDIGKGTLSGGIGGGIQGYSLDQTGYQPTSDTQQTYNDITQTSSLPSLGRTGTSTILGSSGNGEGGMSSAPAYTSTGTYDAPEMQAPTESSWGNPQLGALMGTILPSTSRGWGDLAQGALGLYAANKQRRMARDLRNQIGGNRSAYQTQLTKELQRRDAASGRRSNYAGRATELQSSLAQLDSRNAPAMAQLQQAELGGLVNMFQTGLRYGDKAGWWGGSQPQQQAQAPQPLYLGSLMGQSQGPQDYSLDQQRKIKFGGG